MSVIAALDASLALTTRAQVYAEINRILKPWSRMKSRESELNRRVSGEREKFLHECWNVWTSKGKYHSMAKAAKRMAEIRDELDGIAFKPETSEDDDAVRRELETEFHALSLVGGARAKSVIDLLQVAWELENGIAEDRKAHGERVKRTRERNHAAYMEIAEAAKAARSPKRRGNA